MMEVWCKCSSWVATTVEVRNAPWEYEIKKYYIAMLRADVKTQHVKRR
jgi:hypothetical protein